MTTVSGVLDFPRALPLHVKRPEERQIDNKQIRIKFNMPMILFTKNWRKGFFFFLICALFGGNKAFNKSERSYIGLSIEESSCSICLFTPTFLSRDSKLRFCSFTCFNSESRPFRSLVKSATSFSFSRSFAV